MKKLRILTVLSIGLLIGGTNAYAQTNNAEKSKQELKAEKKALKKQEKADRKEQSEAARKASRDYSRYQSLAEVLRQQPAVMVTGTGQTASVQIRGATSMLLDNRPLFVYDGIRMGRDYAKVNNAVNLANIKSIRVLSSLSETNFYGEDGRNGVIVIKSVKK